MKFIVMSDSHGMREPIKKIFDDNPDAEGFFHLGDGWGDYIQLDPGYARFFLAVRGNCDWGCTMPSMRELTLDGVKIVAVHGHEQGAKNGLSGLHRLGLEKGAQLVMYGHVHKIALNRYDDGVTLLCPGALCNGATYAEVEIDGDGELHFRFREV